MFGGLAITICAYLHVDIAELICTSFGSGQREYGDVCYCCESEGRVRSGDDEVCGKKTSEMGVRKVGCDECLSFVLRLRCLKVVLLYSLDLERHLLVHGLADFIIKRHTPSYEYHRLSLLPQ
jgi:hypothetical protein